MPYNLDIPGFMNETSLQILEFFASQVPPEGVIVEIGSFMGRSAWTFAKSCHSSTPVYCIDTWEEQHLKPLIEHPFMDAPQKDQAYTYEKFLSHVSDCPNIIPIKGKSTEIKWPEERKIDFVFIDASHVSPDVDNDIATWLPRLKPTGVLSGHDFNVQNYPDVCRAVIAISEKIGLPIKFFKKSSIWMIDNNENLDCPYELLVATPQIIEQVKEVLKD